MTSPKSKKLLKSYSILAAVAVVLGIVSFIISGHFTELADDLRGYYSFYTPQSVLSEIAIYEMFSLILIIVGVIAILCGGVCLALYFFIYSKTHITIESDGRVHGIAICGTNLFKTVNFSGTISDVVAPLMHKNMLCFDLNGKRYVIYTDDPAPYYNVLSSKVKKA